MSLLRNLIAGIISMVFLCGCAAPEFILTFDSIDGLEKDAPVFFEGLTIGKVEKVAYEASGNFLVTVSIKTDFSSAVTEHSKFVIQSSPASPEKKSILMTHAEKGGTPLKSGARIKGESSSPLAELKPFMEQMEKRFDTFMDNLRGIPESEQYKSFERKLDELKKEMEESGKSVQDEIRTKIIPRLKQEAEKLKQALEDLGRKNEADSIEEKMNNLQDI